MNYKVEPEAVMQCASKLADIERKAAEIMKLAQDANPEWYIWGGLGYCGFAQLYWSYAEGIYEHLGDMGDALKDRAVSLACSASQYKENDKAIADALKGIRGLLKD
ncbi:hypothetical protein [Longispora albida]|uniref:hypothetical protein n=1 Tax=Longispora albida TaxID=203523 RepID=UPI00036AB74E|nr:hypothetical protein [Longispora albida]